MSGKAFLQTLAHLHLHKVALRDKLFGVCHGFEVIGLVESALHGFAFVNARHGRTGWLGQAAFKRAQALPATAVGFGGLWSDVHNQVELA